MFYFDTNTAVGELRTNFYISLLGHSINRHRLMIIVMSVLTEENNEMKHGIVYKHSQTECDEIEMTITHSVHVS